MNVLELYSGVGGMHMALNESGVYGKIVAAVEINTVANAVYSHNFPDTLLLNKNIQGLSPEFINKLNVNAIFMSPPCQPFTRNGLKKDELDPRTCSFSHLLQIFPQLNVEYILLENVKGFEKSLMRDKFIITLKNCNFTFQEFIISPTLIGVSNTRHRYYCIAKKLPLNFNYPVGDLMESLPNNFENDSDLFPISDILERNFVTADFLLPDSVLLKRANVIDICNPESRRSCCFTKAYGKYVEGTGSIFTPKSENEIEEVYKQLNELSLNQTEYIECAQKLELRFFTAKEIARLMSFQESFSFPDNITKNQKYKLLGNSINVKVVAKLVQLLVEN